VVELELPGDLQRVAAAQPPGGRQQDLLFEADVAKQARAKLPVDDGIDVAARGPQQAVQPRVIALEQIAQPVLHRPLPAEEDTAVRRDALRRPARIERDLDRDIVDLRQQSQAALDTVDDHASGGQAGVAIRNVLALLQASLRRAHLRVEDLSIFGVRQRIARFLIRLADWTGRQERGRTVVPLALSRQELAALVGTTMETTIRVMSGLRQQGLVEPARRGVVLTDRAALERVAAGAP
jgi:hypothetical protein